MALKINPSKLLPQSKSSALVKTEKPTLKISEKKSNIASAIKPRDDKSFALSKDVIKPKKIKDVEDINNKLLKIDKFFKYELTGSQKKSEKKRKEKEKKEFEDAENKLELPRLRGFSLPKLPSLPTFGILDRIKRFLFFTAVGWLLPKIIEFIPKLERFAQMIVGVYKFAEGLFGKLFDGFFSLLKFGGDLKDKTIGFIAQIKAGNGGNFQKEFDKLEKQFNNFVNLSIVAGLLGADIGLAALDEYKKWRKKNAQPGKPKAGEPSKPSAKAGARVTTGRGGKPGLGKGARVTTGKGGKPPSWINKLLSKLSTGPLGKLAKPFSRFLGAAIPFAGAGLGALDATARAKSGDKVGAWIAGSSAALDAFAGGVALAAGGFLASIVGAPVAAALATAATVATGISVALDVILLVRDILNVFGVKTFSQGGRVLRKYEDGGTTRTSQPASTPIRRTLRQTKRRKPSIVKPPKSEPGKDVGGKGKITKLYPDPSEIQSPYSDRGFDWLSWLRNSRGGKEIDKRNTPNPYKALTSTSEILKKIPLIGGLMGASVDIALGQKPDKKIYQSLSSGLSYIIEGLANQRSDESVNSLIREVRGFADGGSVPPSRELKKTRTDLSSSDLISKLLGTTIDQRINEAIQNVEKELQKKTKEEQEEESRSIDMEAGSMRVTSDSPDFWLLVTAALFENGEPTDGYQGAADVAQAIYNRVSLPGWPKSIKGVILQPGQFQPVRDYGGTREWENIKSKEDAIAFAKKYKGYSGNIVEQIAAALLDTNKQQKARDFVGPRDNFRAESYEKAHNHLANETEKTRYGHTFGFEPRGANIGKFKQGNLQVAQINQQIVRGSVEQLSSPEAMVTGGIKPSEIPLTSRQGWRWGKMHKGIDLDGGDGAPISSAQDATVIWAADKGDGYGNSVVLKYSNGAETRFAHLKSFNVRPGQSIKAGQLIGKQGNTGSSTASHLHFEYYPRGGAMSYEGYGDAFSVKDSYFRYGGNVKPRVVTRPLDSPPQQSGRMTPEQVRQLQSKIQNLKPGDRPVVVPGIGSVEVKRGGPLGFLGFGDPERVYKNSKGQVITRAQFNELMTKYRLPSGDSIDQSGPSKMKVSIYSGHADMLKDASRPITAAEQTQYGTMGGISRLINPNYYSNEAYINDLIARKVAAKASQIAVYRPPIKTAKGRDPNSNWERAKRDVSSKITPLEMHHDQPAGSAGLMMGSNYDARVKKDSILKSLDRAYGRHPMDQEKGFFKYGGAILEISKLTPSILKDQKSINTHVESESSRIANTLKSAQMQGGGSISPTKSRLPIPNSFTSYNDPSTSMMVAYQPIIVKQQVPTSSGSSSPVAFPVPVAMSVNNIEQIFNTSRGY